MFINVYPTKHLQLFFFFLIFFIYIININAYKQEDDNNDDFIDVGVRLIGGKRDSLIADLIAEERNVLNAGHIDGVDLFHYHIRRKHNHRSKREIDDIVEDLKRDERIEFLTVGESLERRKREFLNDDEMIDLYRKNQQKKTNQQTIDFINIDTSKLKMSFNDKLYSKQWYLENEGQLNTPANHDINVSPAWQAGYSGKGVTICIVDDGLDHSHPELSDHYRPDLSFDLNDLNDTKHDPRPRTYDNENNHGTRCAGAAAGKANNELCGVGVAYGASIAGIRILDGPITTLLEARGLTMFDVDTDIKSASWGPPDDGTRMEAPGALVNAALNYGVTHGRQGKGTLFVWASGNGGAASDDCGADGYVSHQNIISIGSINHMGKTTYFDEACPSTMAVAYTGGLHDSKANEQLLPIAVVAADVGGKCTTSFFGTSGAAPVAAGAFALVLETNPELGYRDVMHLITRTARIPTLSETNDWRINGAGYHVSDKFGFGVIDVGQMIALAQNWTNVEPRQECYHVHENATRNLDIGAIVEISIDIKECVKITSIEHVVANISYFFHRRGDVKITLISPSQTPSELLSFRDNDATDKGIKYFPFLSVHNWGESPIGRWTLRMETREPQNIKSRKSASIYDGASELGHFGLRIFGAYDPNEKNDIEREKRNQKLAFVPTQNQIETIYKRELAERESPNLMQKRDYENFRKERQLEKQKKSVTGNDRSFFELFRRALGF